MVIWLLRCAARFDRDTKRIPLRYRSPSGIDTREIQSELARSIVNRHVETFESTSRGCPDDRFAWVDGRIGPKRSVVLDCHGLAAAQFDPFSLRPAPIELDAQRTGTLGRIEKVEMHELRITSNCGLGIGVGRGYSRLDFEFVQRSTPSAGRDLLGDLRGLAASIGIQKGHAIAKGTPPKHRRPLVLPVMMEV